ncbi:hypothetical protein [Wenzhouxiangella sp. EGI_FJ10409]|uniref:hypothetical protein n=1 Tax=Wenzhouxiangella sp. EGI_FJ10409 TaxID=3243767 RepID=UPI0035DFBA2E
MKNSLSIVPLLLIAFVLTISSPAAAEGKKLFVNGQEFDCNLEGTALIDSAGDLQIEVDNLACLGGFGLSSLLLQPPVVSPGDSFYAVWASTGADTCDINAPSGWTVPNVGLQGPITIAVPESADSGSYTINLECTDSSGATHPTDATLNVEESLPENPPESPEIAREVLEPVAPGEIKLTWSSSADATDCEAESTPEIGEWDGSVGIGENQEIVLSDLGVGSYTFALRCSNSAGDSPWESVSATIASSTQCADRQPPSGWARMGEAGTSACYWQDGWKSNDCTIWDGGISNVPFYEETGNSHRLAYAGRPDAEQYLAIELNTSGMSSNDNGRLQASSSDPFAASARALVTISSCPGDFHEAEVMQDTGCYGSVSTFSQSLNWGGATSGETCVLESGKTYYLNIIPTTSPEGTDPEMIEPHPNCEEDVCGRVTAWQ